MCAVIPNNMISWACFMFSTLPRSGASGFDKFADFKDKKRFHTEKRKQTVRSIFRKSHRMCQTRAISLTYVSFVDYLCVAGFNN